MGSAQLWQILLISHNPGGIQKPFESHLLKRCKMFSRCFTLKVIHPCILQGGFYFTDWSNHITSFWLLICPYGDLLCRLTLKQSSWSRQIRSTWYFVRHNMLPIMLHFKWQGRSHHFQHLMWSIEAEYAFLAQGHTFTSCNPEGTFPIFWQSVLIHYLLNYAFFLLFYWSVRITLFLLKNLNGRL